MPPPGACGRAPSIATRVRGGWLPGGSGAGARDRRRAGPKGGREEERGEGREEEREAPEGGKEVVAMLHREGKEEGEAAVDRPWIL